jgi:hypothetical protein
MFAVSILCARIGVLTSKCKVVAMNQLTDGTPGIVTVKVTAFETGDANHQRHGGQGNKGILLEELRKRFGGDEGEMIDPFLGQKHSISLKPWSHLDPTTTYISIAFHFTPSRQNSEQTPPQ